MRQRVLEGIREDGPIGFDTYMALCLYDPDAGFFASDTVRAGTDGDFVTSPEVSPWFGRLIGRWAAEQFPQGTATLLEVGGGTGALLEALVVESGDAFGEIAAVELSPGARRSIGERVPRSRLFADVAELPADVPVVVVVNELLDNLPTRLVERTAGGWNELLVGESDGALGFVSAPADSELSAWCDRRLGSVHNGAVLAAQIEVEQWLTKLLGHFSSARVLVIDYADSTSRLAERPRQDIVRTFARQRSGHDLFAEPGSTDITLEVNSDVVVSAIEDLGASVTVTDQRTFLTCLGADEAIESLVEVSHERARSGDVMGQLVAASEAKGLRALLDPSGLGGFAVISISSGT
ncbi:MAG: SAM-dependent methyltransferase [Acidimicrobiia bacterium]